MRRQENHPSSSYYLSLSSLFMSILWSDSNALAWCWLLVNINKIPLKLTQLERRTQGVALSPCYCSFSCFSCSSVCPTRPPQLVVDDFTIASFILSPSSFHFFSFFISPSDFIHQRGQTHFKYINNKNNNNIITEHWTFKAINGIWFEWQTKINKLSKSKFTRTHIFHRNSLQ